VSGFTENDVELAERYVRALERVKELNEELDWTDNDVELAERYVAALERVNELAA
jgi:hypothetical protein